MHINADFSRPALVRHANAEWASSPMTGVERLMLDRVGDEVARATSLVRYAPGSRFGTHTHHKGEEFLVLEGAFSDANGDYGPGVYVRNPPGSTHAPWSEDGCTIFVKLRQFETDDRARVVIDTNASLSWAPAGAGAEHLSLHRFGDESVELYRLHQGGAVLLDAAGGVELMVLEGALGVAGSELGRWDWLRLPPGPDVEAIGEARVYVKAGHLRTPENISNSGA